MVLEKIVSVSLNSWHNRSTISFFMGVLMERKVTINWSTNKVSKSCHVFSVKSLVKKKVIASHCYIYPISNLSHHCIIVAFRISSLLVFSCAIFQSRTVLCFFDRKENIDPKIVIVLLSTSIMASALRQYGGNGMRIYTWTSK